MDEKCRLDPTNGIPYTRAEFISFYGTERGSQLWQQASPLQDWPDYEAGLRMAIDAVRNTYLTHWVTPWWTNYAMLGHTLPCPPSCLAAMHSQSGLYRTYSTGYDSMYSTSSSRRLQRACSASQQKHISKGRFQTGPPRPAPGLDLPSIREAVWLAPTSSNCASSEVVRALRQKLGLSPALEL